LGLDREHLDALDIDAALRSAFLDAGSLVSGGIPGVITTIIDAFIGVTVMGITMYYLFRDGEDVVTAIRGLIPLPADHEAELVAEFDRMAEGILLGHVMTSALQALVAGIGLYLAGISNVVFWTFVMVILGLIPLIGNVLVWGPAGLYLVFLQGAVVLAVPVAAVTGHPHVRPPRCRPRPARPRVLRLPPFGLPGVHCCVTARRL
ncbi:MAG: AI-2E family transporter, partial [Candidatus Nanohaloarchaea archaeon]